MSTKTRRLLGWLGILLYLLLIVIVIEHGANPYNGIKEMVQHDMSFRVVFYFWTGTYLLTMVFMTLDVKNRFLHLVNLLLFILVFTCVVTEMYNTKLAIKINIFIDMAFFYTALISWLGGTLIVCCDLCLDSRD